MAKRILLLVVLGVLAVLMFTVVFAFISRGVDTSEPLEPASIQLVQAGWMKIEHPTYGISFDIPEDWGIAIFGDGTKEIRGAPGENPSAATLLVYKMPNEVGITLDELIQRSEKLYNTTISDIGEYRGFVYVGRDTVDEHIPLGTDQKTNFIEDSYLTGRRLLVGTDILVMTCGAYGPQYTQYISICNNIINSLYIR
jgi:hypothetical protein